jgi:protein O-mannosyl-transferase
MKRRYSYIILPIIVCAVFGNTIFNDFVWDDFFFLVNNKTYVDFKLDRIWLSLANGVEYLPIRDMSYALDYALWGNNAMGFHITNVLLYAVTVLVIYAFVGRLLVFYRDDQITINNKSDLFPLLVAAIFAVHPLHSEIVSFITCRNALLSTLFFIGSCYFNILFLDSNSSKRKICYAAGILSFIVSIFSKVTSITLPIIVLLLNVYRYKHNKAKAIAYAIPYGLVSIAAFFFHKFVAQQSYVLSNHPTKIDIDFVLTKIAVALQIPWFYLGKLLVPGGLSVEYDTQFAGSIMSFKALGGVLLVIAAICLAVRCRRNNPLVSFWISWFFVTLIPVLNLFSTHPVVADRYAYLPSLAFFCLLAGLILSMKNTKISLVIGLGILLLWSGLSMKRNLVWESNKTLWENTVRVSPGSLSANVHIGRIYFLEGNYDQAFNHLDTARRLDYRSPEYDFFTGYLYLVRQDFRGAINWFNRSLTRDPNFIEALYYMGSAYEATGEKNIAAGYYRMAVHSPEPDIMGLKPLAREKVQ